MNSPFRRMILALSVLTLLAFSGCGSEENGPNQPPVAYLTTGPPEGSEVHYRINVNWTATDPDGSIDHYEYAVDPPPAFTEAEIAEGGAGVSTEVIPGDHENPTVTRVSKVDNGQTVLFDWVHTRAKGKLFIFSATEWDSAGTDTLGRFKGMHALYVRAVDDDHAVSMPEKVAFTATTIAPRSQFVKPDAARGLVTLGPRPTLAWSGVDPDGIGPLAYEYALVRLDTRDPPLSFWDEPTGVLEEEETVWRGSGEPGGVTLELDTPGQYAIGVRAIDEAGAVEPFYQYGRNALLAQASTRGGLPTLTVHEPSLGSFVFRGSGRSGETELAVDVSLKFTWNASAEEYGGTIWGYSFGLNIIDLEDESAWSGWGAHLTTTIDPIVLHNPGLYTFHVRARDTYGQTTYGLIVLKVIDFPFDKELLFVDDSFDDLTPRDNEHDGFWQARISNYSFSPGDVGEHHSHLDNDRGALSPEAPSLEDLSRYRMVLWECRGSGYNGSTSLLKVTTTRPILHSYLRGGGKLWLGGRMTIAATFADPSGLNANLIYPKELEPGMFAWDFLKLQSDRVIDDKARDLSGKNNLVKVRPYPGQAEIYPEMDVDPDKLNLAAQLRGVSHADALCNPDLNPEDPNFRGVIEPLYVYGSTGQDLLDPPRESTFHDKLTALRWHDPDPDREHGRVQWFGFPLYFFEDSQAQETFNRSMDWFREEESPAPSLRRARP